MPNLNEIRSICVDLEFKERCVYLDDLFGCVHGRHPVRFEEEAVRTHAIVVTSDTQKHNAEY